MKGYNRMAEKGTYSDPRCYACSWTSDDETPRSTLAETKAVAAILLHGPKPYHEGRYNRLANRIADAINKHIPAPDVETDVLRRARSE